MLAHIVTITWGYAGGSPTSTPRTLWDLVVNYPGMLLATRRHGVPRDGRRDQHQGRAAQAALRVVAPAAPLRLPRRRPRHSAPAVDRRRLHLLHRRARSSGGPPGIAAAGRRAASGASGCRCGATCATTSASPRSSPRATAPSRCMSPAAACDRLPVEAGQFFTWRFGGRSGRSRANPYSLSAAPDGRPCGSPCRTSATAAPPRPAPSDPCLVEGPYGRLSAARPHPAQGADDRRRRRHHPVARAGRGPGLRPGRGARALPARSRQTDLRATSSTSSRSAAASSSGDSPDADGPRTPGSAAVWTPPPTWRP